MQALSQLSYTPNEAAHFIHALESCKAFMRISIRKQLAWVQQLKRIELLFDAPHDGHCIGINFQCYKSAFFGANTVFARERTAQCQNPMHDRIECSMGACHFVAVVGMHHQVDVQISVSGVSE